MNYFKTERLAVGKQEVDDIYEYAELLGMDIIKLKDKMGGRSQSAVGGFDVPVVGYEGQRVRVIVEKGTIMFYPDNNGDKWGFCLDTPHNRMMIASHYAGPVLTVADQKMIKEIEDLCIKNGMSVAEYSAKADRTRVDDNTAAKTQQASELAKQIEILNRQKDEMLAQLIEAKQRLAEEPTTGDESGEKINKTVRTK